MDTAGSSALSVVSLGIACGTLSHIILVLIARIVNAALLQSPKRVLVHVIAL
jgi:hypothetical protein